MNIHHTTFARFLSFLLSFLIVFTGVSPEYAHAVSATIVQPEDMEDDLSEPLPTTLISDANSNKRCEALGGCVMLATPAGAAVKVPELRWETRGTLSSEEAKALIAEAVEPLDLSGVSQAPANLLNNFQSLRGTNAEDVKKAAYTNLMRENAAPPIVFGTYITTDGTLHIEAVRTVKTLEGGIEVQAVDISPYDFDLLKVTQAFTTEAERRAGAAGRNPFDFAKSGEPEDFHLFRNLGFDAARVAMGMAMRSTGAVFGLMTATKEHWRSWTKVKKKTFSRTYYFHTAADVESIYYVFTPAATQGGGDNAAFCANDPTSDSCPNEVLATAGVASTLWEGGSLPKTIDKEVYHHMWKKKSRFNILAAVAIAALIVVSSGYLGAFVGQAGLGATTAGSMNAAFAASSALNTSLLGSVFGASTIVTTAGISAGAVAASVFQGVAVQAIMWNPSKGAHPGVTNTHVQTLNDGKRRGKTNSLTVPTGGLRQEARKNVRDAVAGGPALVPSGAVQMFDQRGHVKPDMHAERVIDFDIEFSQ